MRVSYLGKTVPQGSRLFFVLTLAIACALVLPGEARAFQAAETDAGGALEAFESDEALARYLARIRGERERRLRRLREEQERLRA
ncbi:MAG: hypothetical protein ABR601_00750, partial [Parasphingopyxis sp.]|nr:hypothetical protein [Sphingomonadales bacterium]